MSYRGTKMYTKIQYEFLYYLMNLKKLFEMSPSVFSAQLSALWYHYRLIGSFKSEHVVVIGENILG
jgi:hypothetical protein